MPVSAGHPDDSSAGVPIVGEPLTMSIAPYLLGGPGAGADRKVQTYGSIETNTKREMGKIEKNCCKHLHDP
jgi:hypothetical protein